MRPDNICDFCSMYTTKVDFQTCAAPLCKSNEIILENGTCKSCGSMTKVSSTKCSDGSCDMKSVMDENGIC